MQFCRLSQPVNSSGFDVTCHATCHNNDANASAHTSAPRGRCHGTAVPNGWGGDKTPYRMEELLLIHCGMAFSTCPSLFRLAVR